MRLGKADLVCPWPSKHSRPSDSPHARMHPDSPAQTHTPASQHPLSHCEPPHGVGWDVGEEVEGTALQMLEIQHVPSTPPSPTSCSTSPKYLLIFIYILCPRCPAPVRSHLLASVSSCQLPSSSLKSGSRSCMRLATTSSSSMGVGGGEASGLVALGRAEVGGLGDRAARPHTPVCPQSGNALAIPFVSQGLLEGTDGCQMP